MVDKIMLEKSYMNGCAVFVQGTDTYVHDANGTRPGYREELREGETRPQTGVLAEFGREFDSFRDAEIYVAAVTAVDRMVASALRVPYAKSEEEKTRLRAEVAKGQAAAREHRTLLATVQQFRPLERYLNMMPDQVVEDLAIQAYLENLKAELNFDPVMTAAQNALRRS